MRFKYIFEITIYFLMIVLFSYLGMKLCVHFDKSLIRDTSTTTISTIIGYSYAVLFFLIALPRTGFIKKIDKNGSVTFYSLIVCSPAITGTVQLMLSSLNIFSNASLFLFFMTAISFMVSGIFTLLIISNNRTSMRNIHRSYKL